MSFTNQAMIEKYEQTLQKEPQSKIFAALSDAYREQGRLLEAEQLARQGLQWHPNYSSGLVALGRILSDQKRYQEALGFLIKASELAPDNLLAHELLAQAYVELKDRDQALKSHKRALFLNPKSEKAQKAIRKLETLTATDYDEDFFQMKPLPEAIRQLQPTASRQTELSSHSVHSQIDKKDMMWLERQTSLIDALIIRQELDQARVVLQNLELNFSEHPEVKKRQALLKEEADLDMATPLRPQLSREKTIIDNQIRRLKRILNGLQEPLLTSPPQNR